jgi:hypothetical protein
MAGLTTLTILPVRLTGGPSRYQDPAGLLSLATDPGVPAKRIDATIRIGYALGAYNGTGLDGLTLFVPIVLSSTGLNNSFFTSELVLTNRGLTDANLQFTYKAAFGGGNGTASRRCRPDSSGLFLTLSLT